MMGEERYDIDRFFDKLRIEEDDRDLYENLDEVLEAWPSAEEFERGSEWIWTMDGIDDEGDSYHWGISIWFDYSIPCMDAQLYRLYIGSGSPRKNPSHSVINITYALDGDGYPGADEFDEISEELVEVLRRELSEGRA